MSFESITPVQAAAILESNPKAVYVDVRSQHEFAAGHPAGALNIPLAGTDPRTGQPVMNPDFLAVFEKLFPRDAVLLVGCLSGPRSEFACRMLAKSGFTATKNVEGGFGGGRGSSGQFVPGWAESDLPVSVDETDGGAWETVRARALGPGAAR
jgi:rhodanese-related sulfurtransferase